MRKILAALPVFIFSLLFLSAGPRLLWAEVQAPRQKEAAEPLDPSGMILTLRTLSLAAESYAKENQKNYPAKLSDLTRAQPPYLSEEYCNEEVWGYVYDCTFSPQGYSFTAIPADDDHYRDSDVITIKTGGVLEFPHAPVYGPQPLAANEPGETAPVPADVVEPADSAQDFWESNPFEKYKRLST